jgi:putative hydrolase of HD superfamily
MQSVEKILKFVQLTHQLQKVERTILIPGTKRRENDLEHQYQLALVAWYIVSSEKLKLNLFKVVQYALVHDFVEVYAGDTFFFGNRAGKEARERKAAGRIKKEFPEFKDLHRIIAAYESKKDKESKFVYALDKILPMYNVYLDGGRTWRKHKLDLKTLVDKKKEKVRLSPELKRHFEEIILTIGKKEKELF